MEEATLTPFEGEIKAFVRSECVGFQRGADGLIPVVQCLVQPQQGPLTTVYQIQSGDERGRRWFRSRPRIDIPAPPRNNTNWGDS